MKNPKNKIIRLNANENVYGCSPAVLKAIRKNISNVFLYPSVPFRLEEKLANKLGVEPENIVVGAGSVRLIDGIIQTFVEPDEEIIIFEKSFVAYHQLAIVHRRKYLFAKQTDFVCDVKNIFPLITEKTKVIFIANPNNPTGTIITHAQLQHLFENIPRKILIVVDEAYNEYVTAPSFPRSVSLQKKYPNLIILRTFSKIYGLAGLRVGYAICKEDLSDSLKKNRIPFFFSSLSENAALAALEDERFVKHCATKNAQQRVYLYEGLKKSGFNTIPSQTNFLYLWFSEDEEKERIYALLYKNGIMVCNLKIFGQDKALRIAISVRAINKKIIKLLNRFQ